MLYSQRSEFAYSAGAMHFGGPTRNGNMVAGGVQYTPGNNRFHADFAHTSCGCALI
jgi:hypothetical protein